MCTKKRGNRYCTLFVPSYMAILSWRLSCWFLQDKRCRRENFRWYEEREVKWSCTVKGAIWCLRNERFACPLHWRLNQTCPGARGELGGKTNAYRRWFFQRNFFNLEVQMSFRQLILDMGKNWNCLFFHPLVSIPCLLKFAPIVISYRNLQNETWSF